MFFFNFGKVLVVNSLITVLMAFPFPKMPLNQADN